MRLKLIHRCLGGLLIAVALLGFNMAILYSSVPHYEQQGWAEFCGFNACWLLALGILSLIYSESHEVAMRQLDWDREHSGAA